MPGGTGIVLYSVKISSTSCLWTRARDRKSAKRTINLAFRYGSSGWLALKLCCNDSISFHWIFSTCAAPSSVWHRSVNKTCRYWRLTFIGFEIRYCCVGCGKQLSLANLFHFKEKLWILVLSNAAFNFRSFSLQLRIFGSGFRVSRLLSKLSLLRQQHHDFTNRNHNSVGVLTSWHLCDTERPCYGVSNVHPRTW